jgi:hypothetical protein
MAIDRVKQIEIFCAFVIDFQKMKTVVSQMVISLDDHDVKRVEKMIGFVADIVQNSSSVEDIILKINGYEIEDRLNKVRAHIIAVLTSEGDIAYNRILENYRQLDQYIEINHLKRNVDVIFNEDVITSDASAPISEGDLNFLNWIAKLSTENRKEMDEADRTFKTLAVRDKIRLLYSKNTFYFEQVYSNADVNIQKKIIQMIRDYHSIKEPSEEEVEALSSLEDIGILSDINALAVKSKSNVSDHQAFDAFCKILKKNTNKKLINKVLRENIIMTSMYKTHSSTIGEHYALRKMFINARYPYNKLIIQRYMQLLEKNESEMALIFKILKKDFDFNKTYEKYVKSEETSEFKKIAQTLMYQLENDDLSNGTIESLTFIIESFIYMEKHDTEILTQKDVYIMLDKIYNYVIRNKLFQQDTPLTKMIMDYRFSRIYSDANDKKSVYTTDDKTIMYGIAPSDIWYDINRYISDYKISHINKIYLKYDEITFFGFEIGKPLVLIGKNQPKPDADKLPMGEIVIICTDVDKTNFEVYIFGLYNRIARSIFGERIIITLSSISGSLFKKKTNPGLEKDTELKLKKILLGIATFTVLNYCDQSHFSSLYLKKIKPLLDEITSISITSTELKNFVVLKDIDLDRLDLENKREIQSLLTRWTQLSYESSLEIILAHAQSFFKAYDFLKP